MNSINIGTQKTDLYDVASMLLSGDPPTDSLMPRSSSESLLWVAMQHIPISLVYELNKYLKNKLKVKSEKIYSKLLGIGPG